MSTIGAVATAVPAHRVPQSEAREFAEALFEGAFSDIGRLLSVFDHAHIESRHFAAPPEWFRRDHSFAEKNELYVAVAEDLAERAASECLRRAGLTPEHVDHLIFVSTTGLATPSIDARLVNRMKLRRNVRRTPIWGLGCAGGAAGLSRAHEYTRAFPAHRALVIAVELCGLTFQRNDLSKSNLIAVSLFGDGAAAVLVCGDETESSGPTIVATRSNLWYDSLDVMGWKIDDGGLKVLFSRDIPAIVRKAVLPNLLEFLEPAGLELGAIRHVIAHPGGAKVMDAYTEVFGLRNGQMDHARAVLRRYGNMSSPTVLFVLNEFLRAGDIGASDYGVITALGPGFSSELLLFRG